MGMRRSSDDDELVRRAKEGDREAVEELYARHKQAVWRLAWLMLSDRHEAEDAAQDCFLKAFAALPVYRSQGTFRAWLLQICRNGCCDRLRRRSRAWVASLDDLEDPELPMCEIDHDQRLAV